MSSVTNSLQFAAPARLQSGGAASTAQTLPAYGLSVLPATAGANLSYNLAAPVPGLMKAIVNSGASTGQVITSTAAGATIVTTGGSSGAATLSFPHGASALLIGQTTSKWNLVAGYGALVPA